MPIGQKLVKVVVQARGALRTVSTITEKPTATIVAQKEESRPLRKATFDGPYATVGVRHSTTMSIQYQTVVSECSIQIPVEPTEEGISAGFNEGWATVEQELVKRAGWAQEVLETLVDAKRSVEGK